MENFKLGDLAYNDKLKSFGTAVKCPDGAVGIRYTDMLGRNLVATPIIANNWKKIEPLEPGHVQVRVDDLDLPKDVLTEAAPEGWTNQRLRNWAIATWRLAHAISKAASDPSLPEPTEFGARVTTTKNGHKVKWLYDGERWITSHGNGTNSWEAVCETGTVSLGWDE